jgi:outer membrane receptor protein involved in Fe transport
VSLEGNYTHLQTEILSLSGSSGLAPAYFRVGQELVRRPAHAGAFVSSFAYGRLTANITGYARGEVLDVEPNLGAFAGLFRNPGFLNLGVNLNYRVGAGVTLYGNLRNALNQSYEEAFGLPSPKLNFVAGLKWSLSRAR